MVEITDAGLARHAAVSVRRAELMAHMLSAYSPSERVALADMLERFVTAVDDFMAILDERRTAAEDRASATQA
jgi:hypothetical protein